MGVKIRNLSTETTSLTQNSHLTDAANVDYFVVAKADGTTAKIKRKNLQGEFNSFASFHVTGHNGGAGSLATFLGFNHQTYFHTSQTDVDFTYYTLAERNQTGGTDTSGGQGMSYRVHSQSSGYDNTSPLYVSRTKRQGAYGEASITIGASFGRWMLGSHGHYTKMNESTNVVSTGWSNSDRLIHPSKTICIRVAHSDASGSSHYRDRYFNGIVGYFLRVG